MHTIERDEIAWPDPVTGPWRLATEVALVQGRWELTALEIRSLDPTGNAPLTSTVLKRLKFPELMARLRERQLTANEALAESAHFEITDDSGKAVGDAEKRRLLNEASTAAAARSIGRPTHWTPERLAQVASVYREAWENRGNPTQAVAERFHLSKPRAARLVAVARAAGLLPETTKGRARG